MKRLFTITLTLSLLLLIPVTVILLQKKQENTQELPLTVELNEIGHLISEGDTKQALEMVEEYSKNTETPKKQEKSTFSRDILILYGCFAGALFLMSLYLYLTVLRPFHRLTAFAEQVADGDLQIPLRQERSEYFRKFTWAFDHMRREIVSARASEQEAILNNKTVIASLSHDLKTPVASIRAYAEALEAGMGDTPERREQFLKVILRKCDEVKKMTDDMFLHSLSNMDRLKFSASPLCLNDFLRRQVEELTAGMEEVNFEEPEEAVFVVADEARLAQLVENIVANARKYAKSKLHITLQKRDETVKLQFRDYGPGIDDNDLPFAFQKFYRGKNCGNESGAGLGLYIVKYIAEQSGGEVMLQNENPGLLVTVMLPAVTDPERKRNETEIG